MRLFKCTKFTPSLAILPSVCVNFFLHAVPAGNKLTVHLACLRCAKMECRDFDAAACDSFTNLFATAMHLADEQVMLVGYTHETCL